MHQMSKHRALWLGTGGLGLACLVGVLLVKPGYSLAEVKPRVVATIFPVADIVRQIGGDAVDVVTLLPAGASPHTFEPTPAQMRDLAAAALVVRVGAKLDDWALKLLAAASVPPAIVTITDGVELLHDVEADAHEGHGADPHVWLDPVLVRDQVVPRLLEALKLLLPGSEEALNHASERLRSELTRLDADVAKTLAHLDNPKFVSFHSAWRYFARRYGLEQVAVVEEFPGKEPSARAMAVLIESARRSHARALIVEPQFSARLGEQIAKELTGKVAMADPLGSPDIAGRASYLDLMRFNAKAFAEALR